MRDEGEIHSEALDYTGVAIPVDRLNPFFSFKDEPSYTVSFFRGGNPQDKIGELVFDSGKLDFRGEVTEAGGIFVDFILKTFNAKVQGMIAQRIEEFKSTGE